MTLLVFVLCVLCVNAHDTTAIKASRISELESDLKRAEKGNDMKSVVTTLQTLGEEYDAAGKVTKALECYYKLKDINGSLGDEKAVAENLLTISKFMLLYSQFDKAIKYANDALVIADKTSDKPLLASVYLRLGVTYRKAGNKSMARQSYLSAIRVYNDLKDSGSVGSIYRHIAYIYYDENKYKEGLPYLRTAYEYHIRKNDLTNSAFDMADIAVYYIQCKDYDHAISLYDSALNIMKEKKNRFMVATYTGNIGRVYLKQYIDTGYHIASPARKKALVQSAKLLRESIDSIRHLHFVSNLPDFLYDYAIACEYTGDAAEALTSFREYHAIKDSLSHSEGKALVVKFEAQQELQLKDKQIQIDKLKATKKQYILIGVIVSIIVLGGFTVVIFRNNRKLQSLNAEVSRLNKDQEATIALRTRQLSDSNEQLTTANNKLVELIQYNAHNLREPLTRIIGAMNIYPYMEQDDFFREIWPQMSKATTDLDNSIKDVIRIADETVAPTNLSTLPVDN